MWDILPYTSNVELKCINASNYYFQPTHFKWVFCEKYKFEDKIILSSS